jgi:hypothetical protein
VLALNKKSTHITLPDLYPYLAFEVALFTIANQRVKIAVPSNTVALEMDKISLLLF